MKIARYSSVEDKADNLKSLREAVRSEHSISGIVSFHVTLTQGQRPLSVSESWSWLNGRPLVHWLEESLMVIVST